MELTAATLPWNDMPIRSTGNLYDYLAARLPDALGVYLPRAITLFIDPEITVAQVNDFVNQMITHLGGELRQRKERWQRFIELGLFSAAELHTFFSARCVVQPWFIYYSKAGGLRIPVQMPDSEDAPHGVVPCATMQNHGVAWRRGAHDDYQIWLVTARKEGADWDWDSDIGHESAHSAFAQIPLFVQPPPDKLATANLADVPDATALESRHLSRMSYMFMEMSVIAARGEHRDTATGLPVAEERPELHALLRLAHQLMPAFGFDRALVAYKRADGFIDVNASDAIFEIGAAAMRVVPHLSEVLNSFAPPTADWYRSLKPAF